MTETFDVSMPDGTLIENIQQGVSKEEVISRYAMFLEQESVKKKNTELEPLVDGIYQDGQGLLYKVSGGIVEQYSE